MDLKKMKVDKFTRFAVKNFPDKYAPGLKSAAGQVEVVLYYIDALADVEKFVKFCDAADLAADNRVIMVYEKGRQDGVNRDGIFEPFKAGKHQGFKMKAPMLCSVSDELSAFVQAKEK